MDAHRPIEKHDGPDAECRRCHPQLARADQAAYVARWREQHPDLVFDKGWRCPLCLEVVQVRADESDSWQAHDVKLHQNEHGQSWLDYTSLAAAATGDGREG